MCKTAYNEIRRRSSIRQYLTEDATKLTHASCQIRLLQFPTGRLSTVIKPLQQVQNSAAKLILKSHRAEHAKPLLKQLHWLPIEQRLKYKTACLCYQIITGIAPQYLAELVQLYIPSRSLGSSSVTEPFTSPSSKENSMVVVPFASLLLKSGILFLSLSITALPSPPSKLALKLPLQTVF